MCGVTRKKIRRILTKLRGGTVELQVEVGRWRRLKTEERNVQNMIVERWRM